ncbi:MurNAc alpha-1-phosphate uridylyltransferase [Nitrosomonas aestuarii]|uniref:MurNAc alpha-1-phosphate uridylyltransferase n=1 Tax=Nitrosomonas aestuarii TaxID=52441 RepID=A0A1I3ZIC5_9PROT|nr:nucleotidyltransferase family protein [Nitrosomonas aestuarii]SFK43680.1 MurNAc alpha-1-phosphate uridylyltransferase [Nitrosomonas aestuarii]
MILAAGRGERMRPLTDTMPKPLLQAGKYKLIEYQIMRLAQAGFRNIVINHAYLGEVIEAALGDGERYGVQIVYSAEQFVLETAGGIANALPLLTDDAGNLPFLVVNGDIYCEFDYGKLLSVLQSMYQNSSNRLVHLVLVDNPVHHVSGDFALTHDKLALNGDGNCLTFSGIGIYHPLLFESVEPGVPIKLAPILRAAINEKKATGEHFAGVWLDVGTPERLQQLDRQLSAQKQ